MLMGGFRGLARLAAILAIVVVVVGAWVRLTQAGLGCPDWPGCYGQWHPSQVVDHATEAGAAYSRMFDYQKAMHEMVHRYIATGLGLLVVSLALLSVFNRHHPEQPRILPWITLIMIGCQGALGAYTVTLKVLPLVVTLHLLGGLTTLSLLWLQSLNIHPVLLDERERRIRPLAMIAGVALLIQLFLGGWTSTNYAAIACPDFPTCQNEWWPYANFADGFTLWRGMGIDYEGGILPMISRTAIHLVHRAGAVTVAVLLVALWALTLRLSKRRSLKIAAWFVLVAVIVQWVIGVNFIWEGYPLWLGTAHNAGAVFLLLSMVTYLRILWPPPRFNYRMQMN